MIDERIEEMKLCLNENIQCSYGICDECFVTTNPSILYDDEIPIPKEVIEHFNIK